MSTRKSPLKAFIDALLLVLGMLLFMVGITVVEQDKINNKADYVLEVSWTEGDCDIDTWVMDPNGTKTSFKMKDTGNGISIDRDDRGESGDPGPANIELVSFRHLADGVYYISVHNYRNNSGKIDGEITFVLKSIQDGTFLFKTKIPYPLPYKEHQMIKFIVQDHMIVKESIGPSYLRIVS